jgi:type IV secretory pathway VirD2 relaxase
MGDDDDFKPRLGRARAIGGRRARRYLQRVIAAANLARGGAPIGDGLGRRFSGSRNGRGAGVGRALANRRQASAAFRRRVVVKARIVRLGGKGAAGALAHLRYLQRDGTTREGGPGALYARDSDMAVGKAFHERGSGDRHQFRFIVAPEDGAEYDDLKPLVRRLMTRAEADLGTSLDWIAVDHFNTGHPHAHVIVRGVDGEGKDLVIARDYLTRGLRERAAELVDLDLGPRSDRDIARAMSAEIAQERLTGIDRRLIAAADDERTVSAHGVGAFEQTLRAGRLATLARMDLAEPLGEGRFRLAPKLAATLTRMGERGDIVRTMQRAFTVARVERALADQAIYEPVAADTAPLIGRVLVRGLADEHRDRHYLIVDALDGRSHYVALGREPAEGIGEGMIVRIDPARAAVRAADRVIAEVAAANGGRYTIDAHLLFDASATEAYAEAHVRRLEAIRRADHGGVREADGGWRVGYDHLARAEAYEAARARERPVGVTLLSARPLEALVGAEAATWIDTRLADPQTVTPRETGFGAEVLEAERQRRRWLSDQGLAGEQDGRFRLAGNTLRRLRRRELLRVAQGLSEELGLPFGESAVGERIEGVYRRRLDLAGGRLSLIERVHDFTLVPWRPVLDRHLGKSVSGRLRGDGISWTIGRSRSGPSIG